MLISGYDIESGEIEISDFFEDGFYTTQRCKIEHIAEAFELLPEKPCLLEEDILILNVRNVNYNFNVELAILLMSDYLYGYNSNYRFNPISKYFDFWSDELFSYGIKAYDVFVAYIDNVIKEDRSFLDIRSLHVFEQHKVVITELFRYIYENGYILENTFIVNYENVLKWISIIKKLAIKYEYKKISGY